MASKKHNGKNRTPKTRSSSPSKKKNGAKKPYSKWFSLFSNKIFPSAFFLLLAILTFYFIPQADSNLLKINLGVISITASTLSIYIAVLML